MWIYGLGGAVLGGMAVWDYKTHTIPLQLIAALLLCAGVRTLCFNLIPEAVLGLLICGVPTWIVATHLKGANKIGGGDIQLCGALGAFLGPADGLLVISYALIALALVGLLLRKARVPIPFAPFVFPAYLAVIFLL